MYKLITALISVLDFININYTIVLQFNPLGGGGVLIIWYMQKHKWWNMLLSITILVTGTADFLCNSWVLTVNQLYLAALKFGVWAKVALFGAL